MKTIIACVVAIAAVNIVPGAMIGILVALVGFAVLDISGTI